MNDGCGLTRELFLKGRWSEI